jgi:hypothetical protein
MKKLLFLVIAFFSLQFVSAQLASGVNDSVLIEYENVDIRPEFPGGYDAFITYITKNIRLPEFEYPVSGVEKLSFIIETDGKINSIKIITDLAEGIGTEVRRVLLNCPHWKPGEQGEKKVNVIFTLPITIRIGS